MTLSSVLSRAGNPLLSCHGDVFAGRLVLVFVLKMELLNYRELWSQPVVHSLELPDSKLCDVSELVS